MPYKAMKPCALRGCVALTSGRYCSTHAKQAMKHYNRFQRDPDTNNRYGSEWKKIRKVFLASNPLCGICKEAGRLTPAETVHHKIKLGADGGTHDLDNLMGLCWSCHSRLHAEQGDYF